MKLKIVLDEYSKAKKMQLYQYRANDGQDDYDDDNDKDDDSDDDKTNENMEEDVDDTDSNYILMN